jgi:hypothetical protein
LPFDMVLAECKLNNSLEKIPQGIAQKADLELKLQLLKGVSSHEDLRAILSRPLIVTPITLPTIDGHEPERVHRGDVLYDNHMQAYEDPQFNIIYWGNVSSAPHMKLRIQITYPSPYESYNQDFITEDHDGHYTNLVPAEAHIVITVAEESPDAATSFSILLQRSNGFSGSEVELDSQDRHLLLGNPPGFETAPVPTTHKYGNIWRLWRTDADYNRLELIFEGMQRRIPPTELTETSVSYEISIKAGDTLRCTLEDVTVAGIRASLASPRREVQSLPSLRSQTESIVYRLKDDHKYVMNSIAELYSALSTAGNTPLTNIRRKTATLTVDVPRTMRFYDFEDSLTVLSPDLGIALADMLFCAFIKNASGTIYEGILADTDATKAEHSWQKTYGNAFDLLTDLASNFATKHVTRYSDSGISVLALAMMEQIPDQDLVYLTYADFIEKRTITPGEATVRGTTPEVIMPDGDDVKSLKNHIANSEREDELAPKVLLHNIPSYAIEIHPQLLMIEGASGTVRSTTESVRIMAGEDEVYPHAARLADWTHSVLNRDEIVSAVQTRSGLAGALAKAYTGLFSSLSLTTTKGTIFTRDNFHSARVGAICLVQLPDTTAATRMALISCAEDCVGGTCDIECVGVAQ